MDSFALAYVSVDGAEKAREKFSIKVNINLWTQCGWKDDCPILDIGLMVSCISLAKKTRLYIPFLIKKENLADLCGCLAANTDLLGAVFNEPYTSAARSREMKKTDVLEGKERKTKFTLYSLDFTSNDVELSPYKQKGTFLDFNIGNIIGSSNTVDSCDEYYFRFRIESPALKKCVREYQAPNRYFETLVNSTYMVDMRFNNTRSLDHSLVQELTAQNGWMLAPINSLHFLLMAKVDVDVEKNFDSARVLEEKIWNGYVNLPKQSGEKSTEVQTELRTTEDIIAYHTSVKGKDKVDGSGKENIGSWEFFTKIKTGRCNGKTIIPYLLLLILLNIASNFASNMLSSITQLDLPSVIVQAVVLILIAIICFIMLRELILKK